MPASTPPWFNRFLTPGLTAALLFSLAGCAGAPASTGQGGTATTSPSDSWSWLAGTTWSVPAQNLRAYLLPEGTSQPLPVAEQVVLAVQTYRGGYLSGQATLQVSQDTGLGDLGPTPVTASLIGSVTPQGRLNLSLTTPGGVRIRAYGSLMQANGSWTLTWQSVAGQSTILQQQAAMGQLGSGQSPAALSAVASPALQDPWSWLSGTTWYVPPENLLAYVIGPGMTPFPLSDQTVYTIQGYDGGYFWGPTTAQLSVSSGVGSYGPNPLALTLLGSVTPEGNLLLSFRPQDSTNPPTTGFGVMQKLASGWSMENQMATGVGRTILHWAYMLPLAAGQTPSQDPTAPGAGTPPSTWDFLQGTSWFVPDPYLLALVTGLPGQAPVPVQDQTRYTIQTFRQGYFFGDTTVQLTGPGQDGLTQSLSLAGSVTPEGDLYLAFIPPQGSPTIGLGTMRVLGGQAAMENQMSSGDTVQLTHWAYMQQP